MKVKEVLWSSQDGRAEYQLVHRDGSVGQVVTTSIVTNDPRFSLKRARIEQKWVGRKVSDP